MALAWSDWALIGLLALAVILAVIGLMMFYGPRTTYNAEDFPQMRGVAEAEQHTTGRHHQQDGYSTARLGPFPPRTVHPRDLK